MKLTEKDFDVLIEAVDAWLDRHASGELMSGLVTALVCKDKEQLDKIEQSKEQERVKKEQEKKVEQEYAILLKAKLLSLRDQQTVEKVFE